MHKRSSVDRAQDVPQHDTRHQTDLYLPCHTLTKSIKHVENLSPTFYNAIKRTVREQPTKVFLAIVKNFLINNPL
jgi:thiamine pyrophosphate-dependent acetolactate synthase large subunit-like protein